MGEGKPSPYIIELYFGWKIREITVHGCQFTVHIFFNESCKDMLIRNKLFSKFLNLQKVTPSFPSTFSNFC